MKKSKNKEVAPYRVTVKLFGRTYEGEGETLEEAIGLIKVGAFAKGAAVITVEHGDVKKQKIISGSHISRIFGTASPTMKQISMKWVLQLFK